jgi:4-carboxymuconolactone decarboxylase
MHAQSPKDQLHVQRYLSANCFGDHLTRKGLDLKTRELLISVLTHLLPFIGYPRTLNALRVVNEGATA